MGLFVKLNQSIVKDDIKRESVSFLRVNVLEAPIDRLAWILAVSDDPVLRELVGLTLKNLCRTLDASAAMVCLINGSAILLNAGVRVVGDDEIRLKYVPGTDALSPCAKDQTCVTDRGCSGNSLCPVGERLGITGYCNRVCAPLKIRSNLVGRLLVLNEFPREFSESEIKYIATRGTQLILRLHHSFYFPEVCSELIALEQAMSRAYREPVIDHMIDRDSMAYRVLSLAKLNDAASVAALAHNLPKGINWLPRCDVSASILHHNTGPVSRTDVASAIGISGVTVGHYLKYTRRNGSGQREMAYGESRTTHNHVSSVEKGRC